MSYDAFLDRCHDDCGDTDDFDADDFETVFDHETGRLEVVR